MNHDENPFRQGLATSDRVPSPCALVIFGASGDLTKRKLVPALYNLAVSRLLPPGFSVLGVARRPKSDDDFRAEQRESVAKYSRRKPIDEVVWNDFAHGVGYVQGDFNVPATYDALRERLDALDRTRNTRGNRVFYLSTPPAEFAPIVEGLSRAGLIADARDPSRFTRVVCEKPHGVDLASSRELDVALHAALGEPQIYRIDHYLGKEAVQNLLAFRFANSIFEPLWNRRHIDHVQITVAEDIGVEGRGKFYEAAGTLRDIVQNHLVQLVTLVAMEPPVAFDADAVRDEKVKVLRALRPVQPTEVAQVAVRGQYGPGGVAGTPVPGYREEPDVSPESKTETFMAMRLEIDNWRWGSVPFYVRAGKRLAKRVTEVSIHFKPVPHRLFAASPSEPNVLALRIQPDEGISLRFHSKVPGAHNVLRPVNMDFRYNTTFGETGPEAYERLLLDVMLGDATLFTRADEVDVSWRYFTPVLEAWSQAPGDSLPNYPAGTWGPSASDALLARDGRRWRQP
jgi:glucose-6-phosphate 1-dehydrogenase